MHTILLVTEGFPYGHSEKSFLSTEYECLHERFRIAILARQNSGEMQYNGNKNEYHLLYKDTIGVWPFFCALFKKDLFSEILAVVKSNKSFGIKVKLIKASMGYATRAVALLPKIKKIIDENKVSIIYTYWCSATTLASIWLKKIYPQLRVVSRFHGIDLYNERVYGEWQFYRRTIGRELDELYFVSEHGRDYFQKNWGRLGKVSYLGTCMQSKIDYSSQKEFVIVSCSALIDLKRVELIIQALAIVPEKYTIQWHHIGDGTLREHLNNLAEKLLGKKKNIGYKFEGWIENEDIVPLYQKLRPALFITTSRTEGCPVSIQEAFSVGIPGLGTMVGGVPEIIQDGKTGFLMSPNPGPDEIRDALISFLELPLGEKRKMSDNAYNLWAEKFNAKRNGIKLTNDLYRMLNCNLIGCKE